MFLHLFLSTDRRGNVRDDENRTHFEPIPGSKKMAACSQLKFCIWKCVSFLVLLSSFIFSHDVCHYVFRLSRKFIIHHRRKGHPPSGSSSSALLHHCLRFILLHFCLWFCCVNTTDWYGHCAFFLVKVESWRCWPFSWALDGVLATTKPTETIRSNPASKGTLKILKDPKVPI